MWAGDQTLPPYAGVFATQVVAARCLDALDDTRWLTHRTESIALTAPDAVDRTVRTAFRPCMPFSPVSPESGPDENGQLVLPLFLVSKEATASGFELKDERGRESPWPEREECLVVGEAMLIEAAHRVLERDQSPGDVPPPVGDSLSHVARAPAREAVAALTELLRVSHADPHAWAVLAEDHGFVGLVRLLAESMVVPVLVPATSVVPRTVTLSYREARRGDRRPILSRLGWHDERFEFATTLPQARTTRVRVRCGKNLEIRSLALRDAGGETVAGTGDASELSLEIEPSRPDRPLIGSVIVAPSRSIVVQGSVLAGGIALGLAAGLVDRSFVWGAGLAPWFLGFLGIAAISMALRVGSDRLETKVTAGARVLIALVGFVALVAGARIAVIDDELEADEVQATWLIACTAVAALCFVALFVHPRAWRRRR